MRSYLLVAALAALSATVNADDFTDAIDAAVLANADSASYITTTTMTGANSDYGISMIRFTGDSAGDELANQWTKGPVLFLHDELESCLSWITDDQSAYQLFQAGHDVYLGCRRGTIGSDSNVNSVSEEDFWSGSIQTIGEEDVTAMISSILSARFAAAEDCEKVSIVAKGLGVSEALAAAAAFPVDFDKNVASVETITPCLVNDLADFEADARRLAAENFKRSLDAAECAPTFWTDVGTLCASYPDVCFDYCDFFPSDCDEFCDNYPEFCRPEEVDDFLDFIRAMKSQGYYALFKDDEGGDDWATKVANVCPSLYDGRWCEYVEDSVTENYPAFSLTEWEHQFQQSYKREFDSFSATWFTDGWLDTTDVADIALDGVTNNVFNNYALEDDSCDVTLTQSILAGLSPSFVNQWSTNELNSSTAAFVSALSTFVPDESFGDCTVAATWVE